MEAKELKFNAYAGLYLLMALIFLFMCYTEVTGIWVTVPDKVVEAQRVPVEQPETEEENNGQRDES